MCGIAGIARSDGIPVSRPILEKMTRALIHRGPDDEGFFYAQEGPASVGLGFRRLSIIDVQGGHQPMALGPFTLIFNGEIYNYRELKKECEMRGRTFCTQSDTEVILHLFDQHGESALKKLNGMFALAIWNSQKSELLLARDPMGIKPLYYTHEAKTLAFASEIKSLYLSGLVPLEFDPPAIYDYFSYRFAPSPRTVLKSVRKVPPGKFLRFSQGKITEGIYSDWPRPVLDERPYEQIQKELEVLLEEAVKSQMVSDVPLGAFLSGGVDSSLVTALMAKNSSRKVQTFSIGFERASGVNESPYARQVAKHLGTEHHELILTGSDIASSEKVFSRMNEPVADPTILPTAILSEFTRQSVKVALTGEAADELFGGYNRYKNVRYPFLNGFRKIRPEEWFSQNRDFSPQELRSLFPDWAPESTCLSAGAEGVDPLNAILALECRTSLVDRLLMKVDMASMAYSLEARPPYLDPRVVEFSMNIPAKFKIRRFKGKYILRKIAEKYLPKNICWRRKHGFVVPILNWVHARGRDWLTSVLTPSFLAEIPFLDSAAVQKHLEKSYNSPHPNEIAILWPLAVLALWRKSLKE